MKRQYTLKMIEMALIVLIMTLAEFVSMPAQAQNFRNRNYGRGSSKPIVALTVGLGTRSFLIKSDIDYLSNMRATQQGWESSLIIGSSKVRLRTGFGSFKTEMSDVNSIKQASIKGLVNLYIPNRSKYFRPYVTTGIGVNIFTFKGTFVPESPLVALLAPKLCVCQLMPSGGPPPDPGAPDTGDLAALALPNEPIASAPEVNSSRMTSTHMVTGLGGELSVRKAGRFYSMFGELRYGIPIGVTTQNASMNQTNIKQNLATTFGVAIGLNGNKGAFKGSIR